MKLKAISTFITTLFTASAFAADIEGSTSQVTFTGKIIESSCVVSQDSLNQVVDMGSISAGDLSQARKSKETNFSVKISGCDVSEGFTKAYITFRGKAVDQNATVLGTNGNNDSVGIEIKHNGQPVIFDGQTKTAEIAVNDATDTQFNFTANYIALREKVETGDANASADFTVFYK